jgi:hypothetical protein
MSTELLADTHIALKEWALVCDLLLSGRQVALLRKGGILEQKKGFQMEHEGFFLYANTEHQTREQIKPEHHARLDAYGPPAKESGSVSIPGYCRVTDIIKTADAAKLRALEPLTCWTQALFDMRINYKPEKPNFVVIVRACKLPQPLQTPYHPEYAGCHSWVPLKQALSTEGAVPALNDAEFEAQRQAVLKVVS